MKERICNCDKCNTRNVILDLMKSGVKGDDLNVKFKPQTNPIITHVQIMVDGEPKSESIADFFDDLFGEKQPVPDEKYYKKVASTLSADLLKLTIENEELKTKLDYLKEIVNQ